MAALLGAAALLVGVVPAAQAATPPAVTPAEVIPGTETATPALVDGIKEPADAKVSAPTAATGYLADRKSRYRISDPKGDLKAVQTLKDGSEETVRLRQTYHGLEVLGGQYIVRMRNEGGKRTVTGTSGQYFTQLDTGTTAKVSDKVAVQRAVAAVAQQLSGEAPSSPRGVRPPRTASRSPEPPASWSSCRRARAY